ncbi:amino acid permease 3-like protein [Tanacetum coccineum]
MEQETTAGKLEIAAFAPEAPSKIFDDDGRFKRTGTVWTTSAHIITAVIGSGVLSLAWATAQLGWIAGPFVLLLFTFMTYYTSCLLAMCYWCGNLVTGKRNYTYMEAVENILEILLSQIPDFDQISWLSMVSAVISFTYSSIENGKIKGSLTGISVGKVTRAQKIWRSSQLQALGAIAFANSYSLVIIKIKDTIRSPPVEHKTMKKATLISVVTTTCWDLNT